MPPKRKTYIKNCTGHDCSSDNTRSRRIFRILFYFLFIIFIFSSLYMFLFSEEVKVTLIEINGNKELNADELHSVLESSMSNKIWAIFPGDNYFLVSKGFIKNELTGRYKKIKDVEIVKKFPSSIYIKIDEHESLLVWCENEQECFLLDQNGIAYDKADFSSPELLQNKLLKLTDRSGLDVIMGTQIISPQYINYLVDAKKELEVLGIEVEDSMFTPARMSEEVRMRSLNGFEIILSTQFPLESSMKTLTVILKKEISTDKLAELEYVDLRSEYKAFYKFKNSPEEEGDKESKDDKKEENEELKTKE